MTHPNRYKELPAQKGMQLIGGPTSRAYMATTPPDRSSIKAGLLMRRAEYKGMVVTKSSPPPVHPPVRYGCSFEEIGQKLQDIKNRLAGIQEFANKRR